MGFETRLWRIIIVSYLLLSPLIFQGCAHVKVRFFDDSDQVVSGEANKQPPTPTFAWVLMSKGQYRKITTANPQ